MDLLQILSRKTNDIGSARAKRLYRAGKTASNDYVEILQKQLDKTDETLEELLDVSSTTDLNAGENRVSAEEMAELITKYHKLREEKFLIERKLKIAQDVNEELITSKANKKAKK